MFNLEISQSGSYVPHVILNWVILKMVWVMNSSGSCWSCVLVKLTCSDTYWTLIRSLISPSFSGPSSLFSRGSMGVLFSIKNVSFCCHFMLILQRRTEPWKTSMAQATLAKRRNGGSSLSWNCVERLTQKVLVSAHFYFYLFPNARYFVSTSMWGNLFSFFFCVCQYDTTIISFCVRI